MNKTIIDEILSVISFSDNFNPGDYDEWGQEIYDFVTNWVNKNNVQDVEFFVSREELDDLWVNADKIKDFTSKNVNILEEYTDVQDKKDELIGDDYDGPGWDGYAREETCWNENYFFTGSDCSFYVLIKKI